MTLSLTLPYPPSLNRYWRVPRALGRPILSADARQYKLLASAQARQKGVKAISGPVAVEIDVYRPAKRGDLDNTAKVALDSLNGAAWEDDSQIVDLHLRRFDDKDLPRLEIRIKSV